MKIRLVITAVALSSCAVATPPADVHSVPIAADCLDGAMWLDGAHGVIFVDGERTESEPRVWYPGVGCRVLPDSTHAPI